MNTICFAYQRMVCRYEASDVFTLSAIIVSAPQLGVSTVCPSPIYNGMLNDLILYSSYFSCHSFCEFMSSTVLVCLEITVWA